MPKRKHTAEEIINKHREAEVIIASGSTVVEAVRRIGVSEQTFSAGGVNRMASGWSETTSRH